MNTRPNCSKRNTMLPEGRQWLLLLLILLLIPASISFAQERPLGAEDMSYLYLPVMFTPSDSAGIVVDGAASDWSSYEPGMTDIEGDNTGDVEHTDLRAAYMTKDDKNVYYMVELWDPPPHMPATVEMEFYAHFSDGSTVSYHTNMDDTLRVWTRDSNGDIHEYPVNTYSIAWGDVVEMSVALSDLGMPDDVELKYTNFWVVIDNSNTPVDFMRAGITINGDASDWTKIAPTLTDPQGDNGGVANTDLKAGYDEHEEKATYFMFELYDPPPRMPSVIEMKFTAAYGDGSTRNYGTNISSESGLGLWLMDENWQNPQEVEVQAFGIAWDQVIEFGIALSELEDPVSTEMVFVAYWTDLGSGNEAVDLMQP